MEILLWIILAVLIVVALWFGFSFLMFMLLAYVTAKVSEYLKD